MRRVEVEDGNFNGLQSDQVELKYYAADPEAFHRRRLQSDQVELKY